MMCVALGHCTDEVGCIKLDQYSIQKVLSFNNYNQVAEVLNRTPTQCRSHWQKVKQKLKQTLYKMQQHDQQLEEERQHQEHQEHQEREIRRAAGLLMNLSQFILT